MTKDEALRMALDALCATDAWVSSGCGTGFDSKLRPAIAAIEEVLSTALAQPERPAVQLEPVAWVHATTWRGLTRDELSMIGDRMRTWNSHSLVDVYTAIEAKLKAKNSP